MQVVRNAVRRPQLLMSKPALSASTKRSIASDSLKARPNALELPRLPVPDLQATMDRYLKSIEPFLLDDAAAGGTPLEKALKNQEELLKTFKHNWGRQYQRRLVDLDKKSLHNWLDDNIWLQKAYLDGRSPLVVNSNWWLTLQHDDLIPAEALEDTGAQGITPWQIRRAAWMVHRILTFKEKLDTQEIYPETSRTGLWFQHAARLTFDTCRAPVEGRDKQRTTSRHSAEHPRHVLLMVHDWSYAIDVYGPNGWHESDLVSAESIERAMRGAVEDARARLARGERAVPIGVLSADERDNWAQNFAHLESLSPQNGITARAIRRAPVAVSLDDWTYPLPPSTLPTTTAPRTPANEVDAHLHNVRGSHAGRNRWFDKPFTLVVEANTRAGVMGEHSPVDALVPSIIAEYAAVAGVDAAAFSKAVPPTFSTDAVANTPAGQGWSRLEWVTDARIEEECVKAGEKTRAILADSDASALSFTGYGTDWIKNTARLAPDAFVQMALQLAWYRDQGCFTATYETALTRLFHHGRTETIRTLTAQSRAWVLAMVNPSSTPTTRIQLLRLAVAEHVSLTRAAATGKGIDRHLLGLQCVSEEVASKFFKDEVFARSQQWRLSTSGLSEGYQLQGTGFGTSYPDGYGVNYTAAPSKLVFGIESKWSCPTTSTSAFQEHVVWALEEMKGLVEDSAVDDFPVVQAPQARL